MRKNLKRLTSMALALILSASAFPVTAFAASDSTSTLAEVTAKVCFLRVERSCVDR